MKHVIASIIISLLIIFCFGKHSNYPIIIDTKIPNTRNFLLYSEYTLNYKDSVINSEKTSVTNFAFVRDEVDSFRIRQLSLSKLIWRDDNDLQTVEFSWKTGKLDTLDKNTYAYKTSYSYIVTDYHRFVIMLDENGNRKFFGNCPKALDTLNYDKL